MPLAFGAAVSDHVNLSSAAVLDNLGDVSGGSTIFATIYPTTIAAARPVVAKEDNTFTGRHINVEANGALNFRRKRATTNGNANAPASSIVVNNHYALAATWDFTASPSIKLFLGTQAIAMAETSYAVQTSGTGAPTSDASFSLLIGNDSSLLTPFVGEISFVAVFNKVLTVSEMNTLRTMTASQAAAWATTPLVTGCVGFWILNNATTVTDLSGNGNNGAVTGATIGTHDWFGTPTLSTPVITSPTPGQIVDTALNLSWTASS